MSLSSCVDFHKDEWLNDVAKMSNTIEQMQNQLRHSKTIDLNNLASEMKSKEHQIAQRYKNDTLSIHFAQTMSQYKNTREQIIPLVDLKIYLESSLVSEKNQLKKLKNDIKKSLGKRNLYPNYIQLEKSNLTLLKQLFDTLTKKSEQLQLQCSNLQPEIDKIIKTLNHNEN